MSFLISTYFKQEKMRMAVAFSVSYSMHIYTGCIIMNAQANKSVSNTSQIWANEMHEV